MDHKWKKGIAGLLAAFLILMAAGTVFSQTADALSTARVNAVRPEGKSLEQRLSGEGKIEMEKEFYIFPEFSFMVEEVLVNIGDQIEKGTPLFRYRLSDIKTALAEQEAVIRDQELVLAGLLDQAGNRSESENTAARQAEKELADKIKQAEKNLQDAKEALTDAEEEAAEAKDKYYASGTDNKDTVEALIKEKQQAVALAKEACMDAGYALADVERSAGAAVAQADKELQESKKELEKCYDLLKRYVEVQNNKESTYAERNKSLENLKILMYGGENAYQEHCDEVANQAGSANAAVLSRLLRRDNALDTAIKAYMKALESRDKLAADADANEKNQAAQACEDKEREVIEAVFSPETYKKMTDEIDACERNKVKAEEELEYSAEKANRTITRAKERLAEAEKELAAVINGDYDKEELSESLKQQLEAAEKAVRDRQKAVDRAEEALAEEKQGTPEEDSGGEGSYKLEALQKKNADAAISEARERITSINTLLQADGIVAGTREGQLLEMKITAGQRADTGQSGFRLGYGESVFRAEADVDAETWLNEGDELMLTLPGEKYPVQTVLEHIEREVREEKEVLVLTAGLPEGEYRLGVGAEFELSKSTDFYDSCVPLSALREDNSGAYVLVLREKQSILGNELYLFRCNVTVLEKDANNAAVTGMLSNDDEVVVQSSKPVAEGSRVRQ